MLDKVRLVQDLRGDPIVLPEQIPCLQDFLKIATRASGHVTYSFNVPRLENGVNDRIISVSRDVAILRHVIDEIGKIDPRLKTPADQWTVQSWELAENRIVMNPEQFVRAVADEALETKNASVMNFEGFLRTLIGPKPQSGSLSPLFLSLALMSLGRSMPQDLRDTIRFNFSKLFKRIRAQPTPLVRWTITFLLVRS